MIALALDGASAQLLQAEGERFVMLATRPYAPGTPLKASVDRSDEVLDLKVARSVRRDEGVYEVSGRLLNVTRSQRQLLDSRLG